MPVGALRRFEVVFCYLSRGRSFQRLSKRKIQAKGCARLRIAVDVNNAVVIFHDSVDYRTLQYSVVIRICRSQRTLNNTVPSAIIRRRPGITQLNSDVIPILSNAQALQGLVSNLLSITTQPSARRHGSSSIYTTIRQWLL